MKIAVAIVWLISLAAVPSAYAAGAHDLSLVLDKLQRHYERTTAFSAKFDEELAPVGAPKRERSGMVYFSKPGRMRWDFIAPAPETIVSDGTTLYDYDPGLNQVIETPLAQALKSSGATAFLLGMGNIRRDFKAAFAPAADDGWLIHLALDPKGGGYKIEIAVDPKSYDLVMLRLTDQLGNVTRVKFSDIHNDVALTEGRFAFKVPAGADIVRPPASP